MLTTAGPAGRGSAAGSGALVALWLRLELRRRWRALLVLALLVAIASGTVLTSVAGARRGDSALDRLLARTLPATAAVLPNQPGFDWDAVRRLPGVSAVTSFAVAYYAIDGEPTGPSSFPFDTAAMQTVERPVVLQGRLADPARTDEGVVTAAYAASRGKGIGDTVTLQLLSPEATDAEFGAPPTSPPPPGPQVRARIVGVVRSPWFGDQPGDTGAFIPSAALLARYRPELLGAKGLNYVNALVRLDGGAAALPAFRRELAALTGRTDIEVGDQSEIADKIRANLRFESASLLAFGLAALVAAVVLVGQAVARYATASAIDLRVLGALGMPRALAVLAASAGPALAAVAGAALGVGGAVVASAWFPFGSAALYEPAPGVDVDALVLAPGAVVVVLLVAGGAAAAARASLAAGRTPASSRASVVAAAAARAGWPVPLVIGARFALEPGRGSAALPVRPALVGAVTGVLGVLAALTFSAGVTDAAEHPARFGQTAQLDAYVGLDGQDFAPTAPLGAAAADPDVVGILDSRSAVLTSGALTFTAESYDSTSRQPFPAVVLRGAMPERADEVVVGPAVAAALHVDVGDTITATGSRATAPLTVTGVGFALSGPHNDYDDAAWLAPAGFAALVTGFKFHIVSVALRTGADSKAVLARLPSALPWEVITPPYQVAQIRAVRVLPVVLGGFLAVLAIGAVGHALATAVRRRRPDLAVLRAVGMTRWQARGTVLTQATVLAVVGLLFGIPLGLALGRVLWRLVADITPLQYVPPVALLALLLVVPVALLVANALAAWPGRQAARLRIAHVLRAE